MRILQWKMILIFIIVIVDTAELLNNDEYLYSY